MLNGEAIAANAPINAQPMLAPVVAPQAIVIQAGPAATGQPHAGAQTVQAVEVPTTKKGPGSREAIVIGFANNSEQVQMRRRPARLPQLTHQSYAVGRTDRRLTGWSHPPRHSPRPPAS